MSYSPEGRAHKSLRMISQGEGSLAALQNHVARSPSLSAMREVTFLLRALVAHGLLRWSNQEYFITDKGRSAMRRLDRGNHVPSEHDERRTTVRYSAATADAASSRR